MYEAIKKYDFRLFSKIRSLFSFLFLVSMGFLFFYAIIEGSATNLFGVILGEIFIIIMAVLFLRQYLLSNLILGEDFIAIPKITLLFKRTHDNIEIENIQKIQLNMVVSGDKSDQNTTGDIASIFLFTTSGKKYNLTRLKSEERDKFIKNLKERMGEEQWQSKVEMSYPKLSQKT